MFIKCLLCARHYAKNYIISWNSHNPKETIIMIHFTEMETEAQKAKIKSTQL